MRLRIFFSQAVVVAVLASKLVQADHWPQWRGPLGNSTSGETGVPFLWREELGLAWKTELPGWGASTPIVWGDALFATSQEGDKLLLLRLDARDGKIVWRQEVGVGEVPRGEGEWRRGRQRFNDLHNLASPSPATDGETVVCHFGNGLLAAYDFDGKQLWSRNLQDDYGPYSIWWGHSNSPVIYDGLVISACMQDSLADLKDQSPAESYLVAHELATGRLKWQAKRDTSAASEEGDSYTTPAFFPRKDHAPGLLVMGGNQLDAYDPASGERLWFLPGLRGGRTVTGPTVSPPYVFTTRGMRGALTAVELDGEEGERTKRSVVWEYTQGTPDSCSPVVMADHVFMVSDDGVAKCLDATYGRSQWIKRLKGSYKASPVAAEGRIYFLNEQGLCTVVSASDRFDKLAENQLSDETIASPAFSNGRVFIRGNKYLWAIGKK